MQKNRLVFSENYIKERGKMSKGKNIDINQQISQRLSRLEKHLKKGVIIIDPLTTYIGEKVTIGKGTVIEPLTVIEDGVKIGKSCRIGPFARLRKGTILADEVVIGNFVEVNRSKLGKKTKAKHLTYLGDAEIKQKVNIGAGTIIANYDGCQKHKTVIENEVFIGSGTILVAPVKVGRKAMTGAGAVVTKNHNVPAGEVVVGIPARLFKKQNKPNQIKTKRKKI